MEQLINKLTHSQKYLSSLLVSVASNQDWQPAAGEWSLRDIAAHLAKVEKDCYKYRVERIATGENPHFESYFNIGCDFSQFDLRDSLQDWAITRQEIIAFVYALPDKSLTFTGTHSAFGTITLLDVLQMMLDHDHDHLQHLKQVLLS